MSCMARRNLLINGDDEKENPTGSVVVITIVRNSNSIAMHNHKPIKIKLIITKIIKIKMIIIKITICPLLTNLAPNPQETAMHSKNIRKSRLIPCNILSNVMIFFGNVDEAHTLQCIMKYHHIQRYTLIQMQTLWFWQWRGIRKY